VRTPRASALPTSAGVADPAPGLDSRIAVGVAIALAAVFIAIALPVLATLPQDFDEGWFMLDARSIARGERPFVDFPHHELPLHLYLLAAVGKAFGPTIFGYRMLSLLSLAASGVALFGLVRPFAGATAGLLDRDGHRRRKPRRPRPETRVERRLHHHDNGGGWHGEH